MAFKRIVVPYEGGTLSEDALRLACGLAGDATPVTAVYVVRTPPSMAIGAEGADEEVGREMLKRAEAIGGELGAAGETDLAKAPEAALKPCRYDWITPEDRLESEALGPRFSLYSVSMYSPMASSRTFSTAI